MNLDQSKLRTPEEEELNQKLIELELLESQLAQEELELATFATELEAFESRYLRIVGRRFAELDSLNAQIAELLASLDPDDEGAQSAAKSARRKADEAAKESGVSDEPGIAESFVPTRELQELYRELAKKVHPDLGVDEQDRKRRTEIMAEVNQAYSEGDIHRLQAILEEWQTSPEAIEGEDVGARLVRTIRMIARVRRRIGEIERESKKRRKMEIYELKARFVEAVEAGKDLLEEMAANIDADIEHAKDRLAELRAKQAGS